MKKKKIKTLGQFLQHLVDHEEAKQIRKEEDGDNKYESWVFSQIDKYFMDEDNPKLTFEIAGACDTLRPVFGPLDSMFDNFYNGCQCCVKRMGEAYKAEVNKTKKSRS